MNSIPGIWANKTIKDNNIAFSYQLKYIDMMENQIYIFKKSLRSFPDKFYG